VARTYRRDSNGRFASGGGGSARPKARSAPRGPNRLTRDNAGRITSVGGQGATARGGRLRTAGGNRRATQTARIGGKRSGVISGRPARTVAGRKVMAKLAGGNAATLRKPKGKTTTTRTMNTTIGKKAPVSVATTAKGIKSTNEALRLLDNSHQDNPLTRSIDRLPFMQRRAKMDRIDKRASNRRRELWSRRR